MQNIFVPPVVQKTILYPCNNFPIDTDIKVNSKNRYIYIYIFLKENIDQFVYELKYIHFQFHGFQFTLFSQVCIHCETRQKTLEYGNRSVESITNQSFPETRQLGLKKIGRIVRNQRGEDLFGGKSDCFDKLSSNFPQRYQSCQDTWRGTRKWNLLEIWLPNDSPILTHTHTNFHSSCISFSHGAHHRERKRQRKKEGKTADSAFFLFCYQTGQKALFPRSFVQLLSKPICPCVSWERYPSSWMRIRVRIRIILRSYLRHAESSLNPFSVFT